MSVEINKENFDEEVLNSNLPVLLDFWGPRCVPCLSLMPFVEQLAEEYQGRVKVGKVDSSQNRRLCMNLKVMGLPSFLAFKNGQEVARISGDVTQTQIQELVDSLFG